ncbi:MAG: nicotinamide mononucleotide transporter [Bacilli bacterium]|nr:nicotinamide mononucleotide transporter [Bacilli bacterium]
MKVNKTIITTIVIIVFSCLLSILSSDFFIGSVILSSGILNIWFQTSGKSYNYIFACIFNIFNAYVSYINGLYGIFVLSLILYLPLNIIGFISWNKEKDKNNIVLFRKYTKYKSLIIIASSLILSIIFGLLLGINKKQKLEFLDSSSNILNIFGIVLLNNRLNEGWIILLFNNIIDLLIWIINFIHKSPNSFIMMIVSIFYLIINIYGIYKWKNVKTID